MTQDEIDARRYRWLRAEHATDGPSWHVRRPSNRAAEKDLDAAIDAAMADEPRYTITAKGREMLSGVTPYQAYMNNPLVKRGGGRA